MKMIENIKDFLIDKDYYIDIFEDKLHVFNYKKLLKLNDETIELLFEQFVLEVKGNNVKIIEMNDKELMISGVIEDVRIKR